MAGWNNPIACNNITSDITAMICMAVWGYVFPKEIYQSSPLTPVRESENKKEPKTSTFSLSSTSQQLSSSLILTYFHHGSRSLRRYAFNNG
jgi:hypothetical protein